jgi:GNAT superfamily N-acetyltransferase
MSTAAALAVPFPLAHDARIRALKDGDTATVDAVFRQLSATSAYLRFGTGLTRLAPRMLRSLARVEPGVQAVYVAEVGGRPVGLGRWVRDPRAGRPGGFDADAAEIALEVADAWQGHGIGRRLVAAVAEDARESGLASLLAYVDLGNAQMTGWLRRLGAANPASLGEPFVLSLAQLSPDGSGREVAGGRSAPCGCMAGCSSASSARSGWGTGSRRPSPHEASAPVTCWPSSSRGADAPSRPRSSSTWSGVRPPSA